MVIRTGTGGWTFPPWRGVFYPKTVRQADELAYASRAHGAIEINSTYYSPQPPKVFERWASQAPEGFVFTVKASRFCTNRRVLAESGESVTRFLGQGLVELGDRLGPILWQFMGTKAFDAVDFAAFLDLLPAAQDGMALRHCVEVGNASFDDPRFFDMCRARGVAICMSDNPDYPLIEAPTADFSYARLMRGADETPTCYPPDQLDAWADRFLDLEKTGDGAPTRDIFVFFVSRGKVRAPAGAIALAKRVAGGLHGPAVQS